MRLAWHEFIAPCKDSVIAHCYSVRSYEIEVCTFDLQIEDFADERCLSTHDGGDGNRAGSGLEFAAGF